MRRSSAVAPGVLPSRDTHTSCISSMHPQRTTAIDGGSVEDAGNDLRPIHPVYINHVEIHPV